MNLSFKKRYHYESTYRTQSERRCPAGSGLEPFPADRGKLEGMAPAFGMKLLLVSPADAGKTVAQLLGEVETKAARTLMLEPGAYPRHWCWQTLKIRTWTSCWI